MKISKRIAALLLCILTLTAFLPVQALAVGRIDLKQDVRLTISYQDSETPLVGASIGIYLVATADEDGKLTATETFEAYPVNLEAEDSDAWRALASTLEGYVLRDGIPATDSGETGEQGLVSFPMQQARLTPGLYLVLGQRHTQGGYVYDAAPFVVALPGLDLDADAWIYDVTANGKFEASPVPEEPEVITRKVLKVWEDAGHENDRPAEITVRLLRDGEIYDTVTLNAANNWRCTWTDLDGACKWTIAEDAPEGYTVEVTQEGVTFVLTNTYNTPDNPPPTQPDTPDQPDLPQTGQLWWPVPVLLAAGLLLLVVGLLRRRGFRNAK